VPRSRDFRLLLIGQTTAQLGAQVSAVAIPLLAVLTLHASPFQVGLLSASATIAFALIGLPAGAWVDRWPRRPVLIASDVARMVLLATIPLAALLDVLSFSQLVLVSLATGFARVFFDLAYQSYLPAVVGKQGLLAGNSAMETVRAAGQILGPALGGWLVTAVGAANVILLQAFAFGASAGSLTAIRAREEAGPSDPPKAALRTRIGQGLRYVVRTPVLRATAITSAASNFVFAVASAANFIFMARTLALSPVQIGAVLAAGSITVMVGAAATPRLARRFGSARVTWLCLAVTAPFALLTPLAQPGWRTLLLVAGVAAGELGQIVYAIANVSLRQRLCPGEILGRVNATMRFLMMGLFPLGALLGGLLGELAGVRPVLWLSGVILAVCVLPVYRALRSARDVEDLPPWQAAT
jgi:MFS family permease